MALSTSQLRAAWSPPCRRVHDFYVAYHALDAWFRKYNYKVGPGSGAANCRRITGGIGYSLHAFFGRKGFKFWSGFIISLMALAVDINPGQNPYATRLITNMPRGMIDGILRIRTNSGHQVWGWGGYYRRFKDAMHFEIVCTPAQLRTGINPMTLPGTGDKTPLIKLEIIGGPMYRIYWFQGEPTAAGDQPNPVAAYRCLCAYAENKKQWIVHEAWWIKNPDELDVWKVRGLKSMNNGTNPFPLRGSIQFYNGPFDNTKVY